MKRIWLSWFSVIFLVIGGSGVPVVSAINVVCGNPQVSQPPCDECQQNGAAGAAGSVAPAANTCPLQAGQNAFNVSPGNVRRTITDLEVYGAVGEIPLRFARLTTSRYHGGIPTPLGTAGSWRHNFYWHITPNGRNPLGFESIQVEFADGSSYSFDKKASNDVYMLSFSSVAARIEPPAGGTNEYALWLPNGQRVAFYRNITGGQTNFTVRGLFDQYNAFYPFTLDSRGRVTRVTEPAGRYLNFTYGTVGNFGSGNVLFQYTNTTATSVAVAGTFNGWSTTANPLYNSNGTWRTTIPLQLGSYQYKYVVNGNQWRLDQFNPAWVTDGSGNTNSLVTVQNADYGTTTNSPTPVTFVYTNASATSVWIGGSFNGWQASQDQMTKSGSVWRLTKNLNHGSYQYKFYVNQSTWITDPSNPFTAPDGYGGYNSVLAVGPLDEAITRVETSDGRFVTYGYEMYASGGSLYSMLTRVYYQDGTSAQYTYGAPNTYGTRPLLLTADDPRYHGPLKKVRYAYNPNTGGVEGFLLEERDLDSNALLVSLDNPPDESQRVVRFSNGGSITVAMGTTNWNASARTDSLGRTTSYSYFDNGIGMLAAITDPRGFTTQFEREWHFGTIRRITFPDGRRISYQYSNSLKPFHVVRMTNEAGHVTSYTRDTSNRVTRIDYPDASYELFTYNAFGQVLTHRLTNGAILTNSYSSTGLVLTNRDALGFASINFYDGAGRLVSNKNARGHTTSYQYNDRGQITRVTHPDGSFLQNFYDTYGNLTNTVNELGASWKFTYDQFGRRTRTIDPLGRTNSVSYALGGGGGGGCGSCSAQDKPTSVTDAKGNTTSYTYDTEWQLLSVTDPYGNVTSWSYDFNGNRKTQTDANGNIYTWVYDNRNRVVTETNALNQVTRYAYDAAGNRTNRTDAAGIVTAWTYDSMRRVTATSSGTLAYEYVYDSGGRRTVMRTKVNGAVTEATTFTYNARNQMLTKVDPYGFTLAYTYDANGNRSNLTVGAALNITYAYDNRDRMTAITGNAKTTTFTYDAAGRRTAATWPNTTTAAYLYDAAHQLTNLAHRTSGGATIASFAYRYDANGNRTNLVTQEGSFRFDYDAVNWLVAASYPANRIQYFDYDDVGNRTNLVDITGTTTNRTRATFNAANRLTQTISGTLTNRYTYDAAGRLTNQVVGTGTRRFTYDFRSQMRSLTDTNSTSYAYEFDGDGNRRRETIAGTTRKFIYDGPNVLMELDNANGIEALYIHGPGIDQPIEKISYVGGAADGRFVYHTDALGSVAAITDELQATVRTYTYEAFGKLRATTGTGPVGGNRFTYTAREPLGDSGALYYYRWRVMDPNVGRFTSEDPLGFVDGVNVYRYVVNNPIVRRDSTGLSSFCDALSPGLPWQKYVIGPGNKCYHRKCLVDACSQLIKCAKDLLGNMWEGLAGCLVGCIPALYYGAGGYGSCFAVCSGGGASVDLVGCIIQYNGQKEGCIVPPECCKE